MTDLSSGDVFEDLPILRVRFCEGPTQSVMPADLWRGRFTVSSVLETVVHVLRDGLDEAIEWTSLAGSGEELVSERTLRRWRDLTRSRLIGSALSWLGSKLHFHWSEKKYPADQLERLLDNLTGPICLAFRAQAGHAVIDQPSAIHDAPRPRSGARPVPGRLAEAASPNPPSPLRPRGAWWPRTHRGPPPEGEGRRQKR